MSPLLTSIASSFQRGVDDMCNCTEHESTSLSKMTAASVESAMKPQVPLSRPISFGDDEAGGQPDTSVLQPLPPFRLCKLDFREGCYQINFRPTASLVRFEGTLRVDRSAPDGGPDNLIASGDLYSKLPVFDPFPAAPAGTADTAAGATIPAATSIAAALSATDQPPVPLPILRPTIPIFPRGRYHSYLKVTSVSAPVVVPSTAKCQLTIVAEQFNYTQPPAGQFKGSFPNAPTRTVTLKLKKVA